MSVPIPPKFQLIGLILSLFTYSLSADDMSTKAEKPLRAVDPIVLPTVSLWDGPAPQSKGTNTEDCPRLNILLASKEIANGCAVIVAPGGGYWVRAMDHEGLQVAQWLNSHGIHAFLLSYRIRNQGYEPENALLDGTRAMRYVRAHASDYGVDPERIGMVGFSAGCHLITWVAEKADAGIPDAIDPIERVSSRPDFLLMVYGGASAQSGAPEAAVRPVRADTPPSFMVLTQKDFIEPQSAMRQLVALRNAGIEGELHIFGGDGAHGRGMHTGDPDTGSWPTLAIHWLRRNNFLTSQERVAVTGTVSIDGVPPFMAWITLIPVENPNAPSASIHISDADPSRPISGTFTIAQKYGPVPGRYRVEVRHLAKDFLTVPSISGEQLYTKLAPTDATPMEVEIKPGENNIELAIRSH